MMPPVNSAASGTWDAVADLLPPDAKIPAPVRGIGYPPMSLPPMDAPIRRPNPMPGPGPMPAPPTTEPVFPPPSQPPLDGPIRRPNPTPGVPPLPGPPVFEPPMRGAGQKTHGRGLPPTMGNRKMLAPPFVPLDDTAALQARVNDFESRYGQSAL